jgi:LAO/AO transport system kinase
MGAIAGSPTQLPLSPAAQALADGVRSGNRLTLARAITRVENHDADAPGLMAALYPHTGHAHIVGVTGAPGTGKSTLVTALAQAWRKAGLTVAIVAIDPTSPFTGGALLGDRVRMRALSGDPGVFVRSMATRGSLGGLSKTTGDVVMLLDAAGFDRVLVETVGVGQAEVEIASTAHTTLVVEAPGLGDEVQAIKAGILEIADILVVNKVDRPGADRTIRALEMMLEIEGDGPRLVRHHGQLLRVGSPPPTEEGVREAEDARPVWKVKVLKTIASDGSGVEDLRERVELHRAWLDESGERVVREQLRVAHLVEGIVRAELNRRIQAALPENGLDEVVDAVRRREVDPYSAAALLLREI